MKRINRRKFLKKTGAISSCITIRTPHFINNHLEGSNTKISQENFDELSKKLSNIKTVHPSIHFNPSKLKDIQRKAHGSHKLYVDRLYQWVEKNKSWNPPKITGGKGSEVQLEESAAFLTNLSLAYCISRNMEYLRLAKKWALKMCDYQERAIRNYGIGIYVAGLARAYDWLYSDLEERDRLLIKDSISEILHKMYTDAQPDAERPFWWANSYIHHDFCIPMGGFGEAALAMLGETDNAEKYAAFAKINFDIMLSWIGEDGGWHEGVADWCYTMAPLLWFYGAWESIVGENLMDTPWIRNTAMYRLYHRLPNDEYVNLNDSFRSGRYSTSGSASGHLLRRLASVFKDGYAQWLAEKDEQFDFKPSPKGVYRAPYENLSFSWEPVEYLHPDSQNATWNVLWYDPSVAAVPPDRLPKSRHFKDLDIVVMRSGWSDEDAVVSISCGPIAGHTLAKRIRNGESIERSSFYHDHTDYNSFTIFANGQYFIIPPGYARRSSHFQNVVSINGADYRGDPSLNVKIEAFITEKDFSYAVGNGTEGFLPQLGIQSYKRHLVLLNTNWLIIYDDLKLTEAGRDNLIFNRFTWSVHSDPNTHGLIIKDHRVEWKSKKADNPLHMFMLEPRDYGWERELFQSKKGISMIESLELSKPEFYDYYQRVLSAFTWDEAPDEPMCINRENIITVQIAKDKAIGFAKKSWILDNLDEIKPGEHELILFGANENDPMEVVRIKDRKVY
jgi:hypothetical protein